MKKIKILLTLLVLLILIILIRNYSKRTDNIKESENIINNEESKSKDNGDVITNKKTNKICDSIDKSDLIIQLDLPEEFAQYENKTSFPSYNTGFLFKSSYGDQARSMRLASKNCNYRVGFNKEDFLNLNMSPDSPFVIAAESSKTNHFSYEGWPINISFDENGIPTDGMPTEGKTIVIKVNGEVPASEQYNELFD